MENGTFFVADGAACWATRSRTLIAGAVAPQLVADLIENWLLVHALARGWVQCHASAWIKPTGRAVVLGGDSGFGKTTALHRALEGGAKFLSNDRVFLRLEHERMLARGYPLAMNVGCGTIRSLALDLPHRGLPDKAKIRLTPADVQRLYEPDYDGWYEVESITAGSIEDFSRNCFYLEEDPTHPRWNAAWPIEVDPAYWSDFKARVDALFSSRAPLDEVEGALP